MTAAALRQSPNLPVSVPATPGNANANANPDPDTEGQASARPGRRWRLAIDARDLAIAERTGVERVVAHFVEHVGAAAPDFDLLLLTDRPLTDPACAGLLQCVEPVRRPRLQRVFDQWVLWQLPALLRQRGADAYLSLNCKFPVGALPSFTTIHGMEWLLYPQGYRRVERLKQWLWFQVASRLSTGIVTFADNTRRDVARLRPSGTPPLRVVPEGVAPMFTRLAAAQLDRGVVQRLGVTGPYLLSVCSLEPRKNIDGLIRAFAELRRQPQRQSLHLVLVGRAGWRTEALRRLAQQLGVEDQVRFTGWLNDADLVQLYNQAAVFVYPSRYEGFGLPPLEAMACGVPVVTANRSATAEVGRGAALLFDPDRPGDLAACTARALDDAALREQLISAGLHRAAQYTWPEMARQIMAFVRERLAAEGLRPVRGW